MKKLLLILILLVFPASAVAEYKPPPKQPGPFVGDTIKGTEWTWLYPPYCSIAEASAERDCKGTISLHWLRCPAGSCEPVQVGSLNYKVVQADLGSEMWFYTSSTGPEPDGSTFTAVAFNLKYEAVKSPGTIYWRGDGTETLLNQWSRIFQGPVEYNVGGTNCDVAAKYDERMELVQGGPIAGLSAKEKALKFANKSTDKCYGAPRDELGSDKGTHGIYKAGDKVWIAFEFFFPKAEGGKSGYTGGGGLTQWQDTTLGCNPPLGYGTNTQTSTTVLLWMNVLEAECTHGNEHRNLGSVELGKWYKLLTYVNFSLENTGENAGEVKSYYAKQGQALPQLPQAEAKHQTIHTGTLPGGKGAAAERDTTRIGLYPSSGEVEDYIAGYVVASTRALAEATAFNK